MLRFVSSRHLPSRECGESVREEKRAAEDLEDASHRASFIVVRVVRLAFPAGAREVAPGPAPALERDPPEREERRNQEQEDDHEDEMRDVRHAAREPHLEPGRRLPGLGLGLEAQDPAPGGKARHVDAAVLAAFAPALAAVDARIAVRDQVEGTDLAGGLGDEVEPHLDPGVVRGRPEIHGEIRAAFRLERLRKEDARRRLSGLGGLPRRGGVRLGPGPRPRRPASSRPRSKSRRRARRRSRAAGP